MFTKKQFQHVTSPKITNCVFYILSRNETNEKQHYNGWALELLVVRLKPSFQSMSFSCPYMVHFIILMFNKISQPANLQCNTKNNVQRGEGQGEDWGEGQGVFQQVNPAMVVI